MKNLFSFKSIQAILLTVFFVNVTLAEDKPDPAFRLKRGVGACSTLPTEAENFVCKAIGWPDQNARVDLVRQEFVNKYGMTVRWGLFDYYYYFNGIKKCEPHKNTIVEHLTARKDLEELWQKLGNNADCVRKGQGWIQTRNIELFNGEPFIPQKPTMEVKLVPAKKEAKAAPVVEAPKKPEARFDSVVEKRKVAAAEPAPKAKKAKVKYEDEEPMTSVPMAPLKREPVKPFWSEPFPKEFF